MDMKNLNKEQLAEELMKKAEEIKGLSDEKFDEGSEKTAGICCNACQAMSSICVPDTSIVSFK